MALLSALRPLGNVFDTARDFMPGSAFDFTIRASGDFGLGFSRLIVLKGAAQPFQPLQYGFNTVLKKTGYPGNNIPSAQVLISNKTPLRITGEWRDYTIAGFSANYYAQQFEELAKSKLPVDIEWGLFAKTGIVQEASFEVLRHDLMRYDITFEILSDFSDEPFAFDFKRPFRTIIGVIAKAGQVFGQVATVFNLAPKGVSAKVLGRIGVPMNRAIKTATRVF